MLYHLDCIKKVVEKLCWLPFYSLPAITFNLYPQYYPMLQKNHAHSMLACTLYMQTFFSMTYCVTVYPVANGPLTSYIGEKNCIITFLIGKAKLVTMDYLFSLSL